MLNAQITIIEGTRTHAAFCDMTNPLEALKRRFQERCSSDLVVLQRVMLVPEEVTSDDFKTLVHQMSGAAAAFGFLQLSAAAMCLDDVLSAGTPPSRQQLQALIDQLICLQSKF